MNQQTETSHEIRRECRGAKATPQGAAALPLAGFTLLEILLALVVLSVMGLMIFGSFRNIVEATIQGEEAMESLNNGEIIMEQLVSSLRSAAYFDHNPKLYGMWHEDEGGDPPEDVLSWVSGTMAFIPPNYPTQQGLHRLYLSIEEQDGQRGLAVSAYPHLVDPEDDDVEEVDPWIVSTRVKGLDVQFYNVTETDWEDEWERDDQLPQFMLVTLYMEPMEKGKPYREIMRRVDIPLGRVSRETRRGRRNRTDSTAPATATPDANDRAVILSPQPRGGGN